MASYIGGQSNRLVVKNYNNVPVVYIPKKEQQQAMALLNTWFFTGTPSWMQNKQMNLLNGESEDLKMLRSAQNFTKKFISPDVLGNLIKAEYDLGKDTYTVSDLFNDLDHYIYKDFDSVQAITPYTRTLQNNFTLDLAAAAAKISIVGGLSEVSEVLHTYNVRTIAKLTTLSNTHQDPQTRMFYQTIVQILARDRNQK